MCDCASGSNACPVAGQAENDNRHKLQQCRTVPVATACPSVRTCDSNRIARSKISYSLRGSIAALV
jgi:hypothetical protein